MTTSSLASAVTDYLLISFQNALGEGVTVAEAVVLEDITPEMVVFGNVRMDQRPHSYAGEGGAMIRHEQAFLNVVIYVRDESQVLSMEEQWKAPRQRAFEIMDTVDSTLRNDKDLGGLSARLNTATVPLGVQFIWIHPKTAHRQFVPNAREFYLACELELEGLI